jgi:aminoglycoside phosphotransferase (APT) family kinase protein
VVEARPEEGWIALEVLPGQSLHDMVMADPVDARDALGCIGSALARFNSVSPAALHLPPAGPPMSIEEYRRLVATHFPDRDRALRSALAEISVASRVAPQHGDALVHGDLHDRNVVIQGPRVGLLDLDLVRAGRPAEDIGNLTGHLVLRLLQRDDWSTDGTGLLDVLLHGYRQAGGAVDDQEARSRTAETLFRLACLYLFRRRWRRLSSELVDRAVWWARAARRSTE